jgi:hypothetical protein
MALGTRFAPSLALLLVVGSFAWSHTARAEDMGVDALRVTSPVTEAPEAPDMFAIRRLAFEAHFGLATPMGEFGIATEYSVHPLLGLGAGIGVGVGLDSGPDQRNTLHGALLARFRPLRGKKNAMVFGAAYSFGGFQRFGYPNDESNPPPPLADRSDWAHWAQFDVGWERRAGTGFLIRMSVGGAVLLNPADLQCAPGEACLPTTSQSLFIFDFALGYAGPV